MGAAAVVTPAPGKRHAPLSTTPDAMTDKGAKSTRERLEAKKRATTPQEPQLNILQKIRGYVDALVFAYVLAMFIRSYVFELFMIPTGSMTPTLIGDAAGEVVSSDYDGDGIKDVIYTSANPGRGRQDQRQIFLMNKDGTYRDLLFLYGVAPEIVRDLARTTKRQQDMIVVNKFAYWFATPTRGDIAVFKVPYRPGAGGAPWEIDKPVYIKRVVALPGEVATILPPGSARYLPGDPRRYSERFAGVEVHLNPQQVLINGEPIADNSMGHIIHFPRITQYQGRAYPDSTDQPDVIPIPEDGVLMVGDNAASSSDGRYWGHVPLSHMRGKAVFRYLPWRDMGFLDRNRSRTTTAPKQALAGN